MRSILRWRWLAAATLLLGLALPVAAHGDTIQIVTEDYYPYQYLHDGLVAGMATEVVRAVVADAMVKGEIRLLPWARAYQMALKSSNVLIYSIARTQARESLFKWVGTVAPYRIYFYKLKSRKDIVVNSLEDAKPYTIGGLYKDVRQEYLASKGFTNIANVVKSSLNVQKLYLGRIDLLPFDEAGFVHKVEQLGLDPSKAEKVFFLEEISSDLYMAFSRSTPDEVVGDYRRALAKVKADGRYARIEKKYFKQR